ncbi:hypothetical protein AB0K09_31255 [Streptomyces sp. NPDC049577]|uniref:hypothetical protein n=1 Tax=Streptomyces sp. NPDC049577 TaxID=3155153 RepID=UPI0034194616
MLALATGSAWPTPPSAATTPDICAELTQPRAATAGPAGAKTFTTLKTDNARLRREKRDLAQQLELAIAAIQHLSTDNHHLRTALHEARSVTAITRRPR